MNERDERPPAAVACGTSGVFVPAEVCAELAQAIALFQDLLLGRRPPAEARQPRVTQRLVDVQAVAAEVAREHARAKHRAAARIFPTEDPAPNVLSASAQITGPSTPTTITVQQAADILDLTVQHVRYLASTGRITGQRSERNVWILGRESVVAYGQRRRLRRIHAEGRNKRARDGRGAAQP